MSFSFDYLSNISYICCMAYDMNKNYFIECGNDIDMVIDFLMLNDMLDRFGGYHETITKLERRKRSSIRGFGELGGILITNETELLRTSPGGVNDGHLERLYQPLIRVKKMPIVKHRKLKKVNI